MRSRRLVSFSASFALLPMSILGQGAVEGRVGLPELHTAAPVVVKRYEIITRGGGLSTQPPLAVVYLEGSFSKPKSQPVKQVAQKNLEFVPPLLQVHVNTRVEFPNRDDTYHSIVSYSPATAFAGIRFRLDYV